MKTLFVIVGLLFSLMALTAEQTDVDEFAPVPKPPKLPDPIESGENIEPVISIVHRNGQKIEEHRINGNLYMIKVTPEVGPAYHLIDTNGDGEFNARKHALDDVIVPTWILLRW